MDSEEANELENLLSVKEASVLIGCTTASLYLAVQEGRIPTVRVIGRIGITTGDAIAYREKMGTANGWQKRKKPDKEAAQQDSPAAP
jgi:hypothetical protein